MNLFNFNLIYPIFDVESIGDGPRVPRAHLEVVFATSHHNKQPTPVGYRLGLWGGLNTRDGHVRVLRRGGQAREVNSGRAC